MLHLLKYMEQTLGTYAAVAGYLGYTTRQYYNIRKRIESGGSLQPEVETKIRHKLILMVLTQTETVN